jgi:hypothetical protein
MKNRDAFALIMGDAVTLLTYASTGSLDSFNRTALFWNDSVLEQHVYLPTRILILGGYAAKPVNIKTEHKTLISISGGQFVCKGFPYNEITREFTYLDMMSTKPISTAT